MSNEGDPQQLVDWLLQTYVSSVAQEVELALRDQLPTAVEFGLTEDILKSRAEELFRSTAVSCGYPNLAYGHGPIQTKRELKNWGVDYLLRGPGADVLYIKTCSSMRTVSCTMEALKSPDNGRWAFALCNANFTRGATFCAGGTPIATIGQMTTQGYRDQVVRALGRLGCDAVWPDSWQQVYLRRIPYYDLLGSFSNLLCLTYRVRTETTCTSTPIAEVPLDVISLGETAVEGTGIEEGGTAAGVGARTDASSASRHRRTIVGYHRMTGTISRPGAPYSVRVSAPQLSIVLLADGTARCAASFCSSTLCTYRINGGDSIFIQGGRESKWWSLDAERVPTGFKLKMNGMNQNKYVPFTEGSSVWEAAVPPPGSLAVRSKGGQVTVPAGVVDATEVCSNISEFFVARDGLVCVPLEVVPRKGHIAAPPRATTAVLAGLITMLLAALLALHFCEYRLWFLVFLCIPYVVGEFQGFDCGTAPWAFSSAWGALGEAVGGPGVGRWLVNLPSFLVSACYRGVAWTVLVGVGDEASHLREASTYIMALGAMPSIMDFVQVADSGRWNIPSYGWVALSSAGLIADDCIEGRASPAALLMCLPLMIDGLRSFHFHARHRWVRSNSVCVLVSSACKAGMHGVVSLFSLEGGPPLVLLGYDGVGTTSLPISTSGVDIPNDVQLIQTNTGYLLHTESQQVEGGGVVLAWNEQQQWGDFVLSGSSQEQQNSHHGPGEGVSLLESRSVSYPISMA